MSDGEAQAARMPQAVGEMIDHVRDAGFEPYEACMMFMVAAIEIARANGKPDDAARQMFDLMLRRIPREEETP